MAFITADRVKDTSTTTGTGNITVSGSAPFGYRTFSTVLSVADTFYYAIQGQSTAEWEIGVGTYASTNQFARTTVLASSASNSAVSFSSGTKNVFITLAAARTLQLGPSDGPTAGSVPYGTGSTLAYTAAGTAGQFLKSNGSGAPTWVTASGTGTVTSVDVSGGTTGLTASGGPVTTSGTITLAGTLAIANGGTNSTATPTAGTIPYGTGTALAYSAAGTAGQMLTSGGAGAPTWTTVTGTGTVTSVNVSGGTTGLTYSGGPVTTSGTVTMAGTLAVANGGTGLTTTPANGALDIGNGTGFTRTTLTAGSNITITDGAGSITIASSGGGTPGGSTTQVQYNNAGAFAGSSNLTFDGTNLTSGGTVAMASSFKRNRIINGNMAVDQRNAGASVTIADSTITYGVDRFLAYESTSASSCTVQQVSDAPNSTTNGVVFTNSLKFTVGTGGTATAAQLAIFEHRIEGYNVSDFGYGASGALTTTLRFWVKSSVTGTFCLGLRNSGDTRSYVSTYTVSAANTWEQKTITVTGDTTGTWNTTNGSGIQIRWDLGSGSTYQTSTLNAWQAGLYFSTSGQANVIGTSGATFYITGVQLEVGTKATPYEMQIYSDQLAQCQRYYEKSFDIGTAPAQATGTTNGVAVASSPGTLAGMTFGDTRFKINKRAAPTLTFYNPISANQYARDISASVDCTATSAWASGESAFGITANTGSGSGSTNRVAVHWAAAAEL